MGEAEKKKKERKRRFLPAKAFKNKTEFYDQMINYWTKKKAGYLEGGESRAKTSEKNIKKAKNILLALKKDPTQKKLLDEIMADLKKTEDAKTPPAAATPGKK